MLRHCVLALYQYLHHLFSLGLLQNFLPADWRTHLVQPVFKSGDITSVRNYKPISLLPVVFEVLEKLVFSNIVDFVTSSLSPSQFKFLRGHSTLQQLLTFFNILLLHKQMLSTWTLGKPLIRWLIMSSFIRSGNLGLHVLAICGCG